ncbi:hypothetical protein [Mesomycoplasma hyorhinis]|uniref:hypothetical protein n=1 Tax=Mesomycoplasma hyorhinis TaxID=2100 RepID=UPI001C688863|nr:hypothetical protein [Mesomycoplasma hyorhinis]
MLKKKNEQNPKNLLIKQVKDSWIAFSEDFCQNFYSLLRRSNRFYSPRSNIDNLDAIHSRKTQTELLIK